MDFETLSTIQTVYTLLGNVLMKNKRRSDSPPPRRRRSRSRSSSRPNRRRSRSRSRSRRPNVGNRGRSPSPGGVAAAAPLRKRSRSRSSPLRQEAPVQTTTTKPSSPTGGVGGGGGGEAQLPSIIMFYHDGKYNVPDFNDFFSEFGNISDCKAWFWKDQKKYCAKVTFTTHEAAQKCLNAKQKMFVKYGFTDF